MQNQHKNHTVDILNCLANLSSDEIFTPPEIVNLMLDMLPQAVFQSTETTFLDPCTKSGVFLREITKRLLKAQIPMYEDVTSDIRRRCMGAIQAAVNDGRLDRNDPDFTEKAKAIGDTAKNEQDIRFERHLQEVLNHILTKQVFGIAITELTAELSRRSLYCSKNACGQYSICSAFGTNSAGNIRFKPMGHTWVKPNGQPVDEHDLNDSETAKKSWHCKYCGASYGSLGQDRDGLESHAYEFIHTDEPERIWGNMEFTVICGNPPYQIETNKDTKQAMPIYHKFVEQAERLNPKYLTMIIPSRWFSGGIGLDAFRQKMMNDRHIVSLTDYSNAKDCFPSNSIGGGVCYFLRDKTYIGDCSFTNVTGQETATAKRPLNEFPVLVRYNEAASVLHKVNAQNDGKFSEIVSPLMPFGLPSNYRGVQHKDASHPIALYSSKDITFISETEITRTNDYLDKYKVFVSKVSAEHAGEPDKEGKYGVLTSSMKVAGPGTACTHSYFVVGANNDKTIVENIEKYLKTKFVRFLLQLATSSINISKNTFVFVPMQDFSHPWTDEMLYKKYGFTQDEIDFIEQMIKPME